MHTQAAFFGGLFYLNGGYHGFFKESGQGQQEGDDGLPVRPFQVFHDEQLE
jgi:hypothetical protein